MDADHPEKSVRRYASSSYSLLLEFVLACIILIAGLLLMHHIDGGRSLGLLAVLAAIGTVLAAVCVRSRRTTVTVTPEEVLLSTPGRETIRIPRHEYAFTSRVQKNRFDFMTFWTERSLVAEFGAERREFPLRSFSAGDFNRLPADLRGTIGGETGRKQGFVRSEFPFPKAAMLRHYRLVFLVSLGFFLLFVGGGCLLAREMYGQLSLNAVRNVVIGCVALCAVPAMVMGVEYWRRKRAMPERIAFEGDRLAVDDESFPLRADLVITLTPPEYPQREFGSIRTMLVEHADGRKRKWFLGMRNGGKRVVFAEYENLCECMRHASTVTGCTVLFDL